MPLPGSEPVQRRDPGAGTAALCRVFASGKMLLVTDGVSGKDRDGIEKVLAGSDSHLTIMGVGTPAGAPIPLPNGGFLKDGQAPSSCRAWTKRTCVSWPAATGGSYRRMQLDDSDLKYLLAANPLERNAKRRWRWTGRPTPGRTRATC